jgi:transposase
VAAFLGVHPVTVCAWVRAAREVGGLDGLCSKSKPGRPHKLSTRQEKTVLGWVAKAPTHFGFANDLWTTRRLAALIQQRWNVRFNSNCLAAWLRTRDHSPQRPEQPALERDGAAFPKRTHRLCGKEEGETNHVERWFGTLRARISRLVRRAYSFSKSVERHLDAIHPFITGYNLQIKQSTLG